jgi:hypothetical protein
MHSARRTVNTLLRHRWAVCLLLAIARIALAAAVAAECNTDVLRGEAERAFPAYEVQKIHARDGIVTLVLARRDRAGTFAVGLRTAGGMFFTSVTAVETDTALAAERARVGQVIASWYVVPAVQSTLAHCEEGVDLAPAEADAAVREAAAAALGEMRLGADAEATIEIAALVLSVVMIVLPARRRSSPSSLRAQMDRGDLAILLAIAVAGVALACAVAWRLAPETDEVVTLGARHQAFATLLAWNVGGEPYNAPGTSLLFAAWLRVASGFFAARLLSIALIPPTAWLACWIGREIAGRSTGLFCAGLMILAPAYVRIAGVARGYTLLVLVICAILAAVAGSARGAVRGVWVGLTAAAGLWVSYLLWPLAFAAPWLARLRFRDRVRVTTALALMAVVLAPRIANALGISATKTDVFELRGPLDVFAQALAAIGQAAPREFGGAEIARWLGGGIALGLVAASLPFLRRQQQWRTIPASVVLVTAPVLALLISGRGIRERHVIGVAFVLALLAAIGWGQLIAAAKRPLARAMGGLSLLGLLALAAYGNIVLLRGARGWLDRLANVCSGADLLVVAPRSAQMPIHAMLTGDSPLASPGIRWPPVCESDTEWWCRRVGALPMVSVDAVTDDVVDSAAAAPRSVWIFRSGQETDDDHVPLALRRCDVVARDPFWRILQCSGMALRRG